MTYQEIYQDLFSVEESYFLAHCISSDAKMGAGIAVLFKQKFNLKPIQEKAKKQRLTVGTCVKEGRVLNLITKECYYHKPTYETFTQAMIDMKRIVLEKDIRQIAMPQVGAGLDRLSWEKNREIIQEIFFDTDIELLVCKIR